ncbi:MAG TPA: hypothetical protein VIC28_16185, partial [Thermoanaerobaculia bacterium]
MKPLLRLVVVLLALLAGAAAAALAAPAAYIVTLKQDSGAVHAARARAAGNPLSATDLESYRADLRGIQDELLAALTAAGVHYTLATAPAPDFNGG